MLTLFSKIFFHGYGSGSESSKTFSPQSASCAGLSKMMWTQVWVKRTWPWTPGYYLSNLIPAQLWFLLLINTVFKRTNSQFDIWAQFTKHLKNSKAQKPLVLSQSFMLIKIPGFQIFMASSIKVFFQPLTEHPCRQNFLFPGAAICHSY